VRCALRHDDHDSSTSAHADGTADELRAERERAVQVRSAAAKWEFPLSAVGRRNLLRWRSCSVRYAVRCCAAAVSSVAQRKGAAEDSGGLSRHHDRPRHADDAEEHSSSRQVPLQLVSPSLCSHGSSTRSECQCVPRLDRACSFVCDGFGISESDGAHPMGASVAGSSRRRSRSRRKLRLR